MWDCTPTSRPFTKSQVLASTEASPAELSALISHADQVMDAAEQAGRNQVWSWRSDGPEPAQAKN